MNISIDASHHEYYFATCPEEFCKNNNEKEANLLKHGFTKETSHFLDFLKSYGTVSVEKTFENMLNSDVMIFMVPRSNFEPEDAHKLFEAVKKGKKLILVGLGSAIFQNTLYLNSISKYFGCLFGEDFIVSEKKKSHGLLWPLWHVLDAIFGKDFTLENRNPVIETISTHHLMAKYIVYLDHPITKNLDHIQINCASSILSDKVGLIWAGENPTSSKEGDALKEDLYDCILVALEEEKGKVVCVSDATLFDNNNFKQNKELCKNIFNWLTM